MGPQINSKKKGGATDCLCCFAKMGPQSQFATWVDHELWPNEVVLVYFSLEYGINKNFEEVVVTSEKIF